MSCMLIDMVRFWLSLYLSVHTQCLGNPEMYTSLLQLCAWGWYKTRTKSRKKVEDGEEEEVEDGEEEVEDLVFPGQVLFSTHRWNWIIQLFIILLLYCWMWGGGRGRRAGSSGRRGGGGLDSSRPSFVPNTQVETKGSGLTCHVSTHHQIVILYWIIERWRGGRGRRGSSPSDWMTPGMLPVVYLCNKDNTILQR